MQSFQPISQFLGLSQRLLGSAGVGKPSDRTAAAFTGETLPDLLNQPRAVLEALYQDGDCTPPPADDLSGWLSMFTGGALNTAVAVGLRHLWYGKTTAGGMAPLYNNVLGWRCFPGRLSIAASLFDGSDALIASYPSLRLPLPGLNTFKFTSRKLQVRNEFRRVGPRLYLGRTYLVGLGAPRFGCDFFLVASQSRAVGDTRDQ